MVKVDIGVIQQVKSGNEINGDAYGVFELEERVMLVVADGLGSGPEARKASQLAVDFVGEHLTLSPGKLINLLHEKLKRTRGAVLAIVEINFKTLHLTYAGVGNVQGVIYGKELTHLISNAGVVGYRISQSIQEKIYQFQIKDTLIFYTDGLILRNFSHTPILSKQFAAQHLIELLADEAEKKNDDLTMVALTFKPKE